MGKITPPASPITSGGEAHPPPMSSILPDWDQAANLEGDSDSGVGVRGVSNSGIGVVGTSSTDDGVHGRSGKGAGVHGVGNPAGKFDGHVVVSGDLNAGAVYSAGAIAGGSMNIKGGISVGTVQTGGDVNVGGSVNVAGDVVFSGGDCAEEIEAATEIDPGSVVVIDGEGRLAICGAPYDKRVVGVVSGAGPLKPAIILGRAADGRPRAPLALSGRVYCKVDAGFDPVEVGDFLTTSPTPGHAMRADPARSSGCVLGKSLGRLGSGRGLLPVLVSLQ